MLSREETQAIVALMRRQVVPAVGCTEPIAVALCVARARELLGYEPETVELSLSANILKNAMGVGIPGTGMIGLPIAVALGALVGRSEYQLEVLKDSDSAAVARGRQFVDEGRITIRLEEDDPDKLYIRALCRGNDHEGEAVIKGHHTSFVYLRRDADVRLDKRSQNIAAEDDECGVCLTMRKVYDFAVTSDLDTIRFILEAKRLNERAAADGLRENYGHQLGKTLCSPLGKGIMGESIFSKILSVTSCACDARMATKASAPPCPWWCSPRRTTTPRRSSSAP